MAHISVVFLVKLCLQLKYFLTRMGLLCLLSLFSLVLEFYLMDVLIDAHRLLH